jgi:cellulose synthase/poly-beta-1,6-N-acetylglucosamine synthase-like glycosyltransferase
VAGLKDLQVRKLHLSDAELPRYSILVPMYREAKVIPRLMQALRQLDYPKAKLQILLLLEEDDEDSLQAVLAQQPEACFEIIRVPPSEPRTKPKAMNIGLRYATGEYLVIYDAEDRPDRYQLRLAAGVFAAHRDLPNLCLQGRLNYDNYTTNLLTRLFALEYGAWFETMLPGIARLGLPVPLGGTSNHFRTVDLRNLLGWDAYNVTEDADLGLRLYANGGRTLILPSRTLEEAPIRLGAWLKQRSRWVKGYMVTYLVQQRQGWNLLRKRGLAAWLSVQLFIAGPWILFLACPWLTGYALLDLIGHLPQAWRMPETIRWFGYSALLLSIGLHGWQAWLASRRAELKLHWLWCTLFPFYWLLHSAAAYIALWELFHRPYYWAKTAHGEDPAAFREFPIK